MASTIFLGRLFGMQESSKKQIGYLDMWMRSTLNKDGKTGELISPIIAKGNKIEGIEAKE